MMHKVLHSNVTRLLSHSFPPSHGFLTWHHRHATHPPITGLLQHALHVCSSTTKILYSVPQLAFSHRLTPFQQLYSTTACTTEHQTLTRAHVCCKSTRLPHRDFIMQGVDKGDTLTAAASEPPTVSGCRHHCGTTV
jgi:hypothetical protein